MNDWGCRAVSSRSLRNTSGSRSELSRRYPYSESESVKVLFDMALPVHKLYSRVLPAPDGSDEVRPCANSWE